MALAEVSTDLEEGGAAVLDDPEDETEAGAEGEAGGDAAGADSESGAGGEAEADDGEVIVSIGEPAANTEQDDQPAPAWVKELRKSNRELVRRQRELEAENARLKGGAQAPQPLGEKPTLAACDYDEDKFERELTAWHQRKQAQENEQRQREQQAQQAQQAWQQTLQGYAAEKQALKVPDFEDAEASAFEVLSPVQQAIIINGAKSRAVVMYALGKNPAKAKELAAIADPIKFAFAVAALEAQLKITPRKAAPVPERTVRGGSTSSPMHTAASNKQLEQLRQKAAETGDFTAYFEAKRKAQAR